MFRVAFQSTAVQRYCRQPGSLSLNQRFNIIPIFPKKLIIAQNQLKKVSLVPFVGPINKSAANFKPKRDQNGPL
jgi:hypothetical protein